MAGGGGGQQRPAKAAVHNDYNGEKYERGKVKDGEREGYNRKLIYKIIFYK